MLAENSISVGVSVGAKASNPVGDEVACSDHRGQQGEHDEKVKHPRSDAGLIANRRMKTDRAEEEPEKYADTAHLRGNTTVMALECLHVRYLDVIGYVVHFRERVASPNLLICDLGVRWGRILLWG